MADKTSKEEEKSKETDIEKGVEVASFLNDSSLHGVRYLSSDSPIITRIVWGVFVIAAVTYIGINLNSIVELYRTYPVRNNIRTIAPKTLEFPTVTICDRNIMMMSKSDQMDPVLSAIGPSLMMALFDPDASNYRDPNVYDWSDPFMVEFNRQMSGGSGWKEMLEVVSPRLDESFRSCNAYVVAAISSILSWCDWLEVLTMFDYCITNRWRGQVVDCSEVFTEVITHHGLCLRFNPDGNTTTNSAGAFGGLELKLTTKVEQYYIGPRSMASGFMVALHDKDFAPNFDRDLINVPNGFATDIKVRRHEILKLPYPADGMRSDCIDTADPKYVNPLADIEVAYSASACMLQCEVEYVNKTCGCFIMTSIPPGKSSVMPCDFQEILKCALVRVNNFTTDPEGIESCSCPDRCHKTTYSTSASAAVYPSYYVIAAATGEPQNNVWRFNKSISHVTENDVLLNIFFDQLDYTFIEQELEYPPEKLLGDCGGTMGILLGASFMSIMEFIHFFISMCIHSCNKRRQARRVRNAAVIMVEPASSPAPAYSAKY